MSETDTRQPAYLIIGAGGGIGSSVVRQLRAGGSSLLLAGRNAETVKTLAEEAGCSFRKLDARDPAAVEQAALAAVEQFGRLDGMVNCAGSLLLKPAHLTSAEDWSETISTNLGTAFSTVRAAGRVMKDGGSVVLVSSAAARIGLANHEAIAAAKAGVIGLTISAAATYGPRGLRVNAVAPGLVRTPMTQRIVRNPAVAAGSAAMHAAGRLGEPADVARMIAWLLSPENDWITGQVLGVDGGLGTVRTRA